MTSMITCVIACATSIKVRSPRVLSMIPESSTELPSCADERLLSCYGMSYRRCRWTSRE